MYKILTKILPQDLNASIDLTYIEETNNDAVNNNDNDPFTNVDEEQEGFFDDDIFVNSPSDSSDSPSDSSSDSNDSSSDSSVRSLIPNLPPSIQVP